MRGAALLLALAACTGKPASQAGRPCERGACLEGYVCHPEQAVCVAKINISCTGGGLCPEDVREGDGCSSPGSFIPCTGTLAFPGLPGVSPGQRPFHLARITDADGDGRLDLVLDDPAGKLTILPGRCR